MKIQLELVGYRQANIERKICSKHPTWTAAVPSMFVPVRQKCVKLLFESVLHFGGEGVHKVVRAVAEVFEVAEDDVEPSCHGEVPCS